MTSSLDPVKHVLLAGLVGILSASVMISCEEAGGTKGSTATSAGDSNARLKNVNIWTTYIANSFRAMRDAENAFQRSNRKPLRADLDLFWMALQSTTRNMERIQRTLTEDPGLSNDIRNLWNGRIQEGLAQVEESGLLTKMNGPITSRLGDAFGAERVENDINRLLTAAHSIQVQLGVPTSTPE